MPCNLIEQERSRNPRGDLQPAWTVTRPSHLMTSLPLLSRRGIRTKSRKLYLRRLLCCISSRFTLRTSHAVRRPCSPSNRELPNPWICAELQRPASTTFRKDGALLVDFFLTLPSLALRLAVFYTFVLLQPSVPWHGVSSSDFNPVKRIHSSAHSQKQQLHRPCHLFSVLVTLWRQSGPLPNAVEGIQLRQN